MSGYAVAAFCAGALLVLVVGLAIAYLPVPPCVGPVDHPLPPLPADASAGRFVVTVEQPKRQPVVVYRGADGARARDQFTANAAIPDRRVILTDDGAVRGVSDYGATH